MDKGGDSLTLGLVRLRIPSIAKLPATFVPTIMKIKDNVVVKGHWKDLLFVVLSLLLQTFGRTSHWIQNCQKQFA